MANNYQIGGAVREDTVNGKVVTTPLASPVQNIQVGGAMANGMITQNGTDPITPERLQSATALKTPPPPNNGTTESINGLATSVYQSTKAQALADETARKEQLALASKNESADALKSLYDELSGVPKLQDKLETDTNYAGKAQKVTDVTNQIEASQRSQQNELRALEGQGLTDVQKSQQAREINRRYAFEQADLALIQSAANRDLATAQSIIDRKIQLQTESIKNRLDYAKFIYDENKESFNKAEDRAFQNKIKELDRKYEKEKEDAKLIGNLQFEIGKNGGSPALIRQVGEEFKRTGDYGKAVALAGSFAGDVLDREIKKAQLAKIYADIAEKQSGGIKVDANNKVVVKPEEAIKINKDLVSNDAYKAIRKGQDSLQFLRDFEDLFSETGATSAVFSPRQNAELKAKYNAAILNLKEFFNLGVLNGPDEAFLKGILPDPTNRSAVATTASLGVYSPFAQTKAGLDTMKKNIETTIDDRFKSLSAQYGDYSPESIGSLRDLQRVYISQKSSLNPEVANLVAENPDLTYEDIINIITTQ